ncbi:hypothetical protein BJF86_10820 [Serinicoccus sp. CNJ-927]|uniref:sensor histidine kinase n=1 Tax=Serinicoccus sp. CNJ-927 TaxID=1904970 RepID=UPI000960602F|nr:HAMP domain-containing sensor histidine kinase [Serinicoccus sp. CNJ-927]OLT44920.1 hypothetical protein BJF86_10820 [Serinicoccus sp. CNJ-927]
MLQHLRRAAYSKLHRLSLTRRLVTVLVLLVLAAYLLTTSVTITMLRGYLVDRVDADLETYIDPLAERVSAQLLEDATGQQSSSAELWLPPNSYYILLTPGERSSRTITLASRGMDDTPDLRRVDLDDDRLGTPFTVGSTEGVGTWRVLAVPLDERQDVFTGTIAVALPLDEVDSTARQLAFLTVVIGLTTMVVVGVLGWFAVRRAFRPLSRMEDTAAAIAAGDLTRRIPPPGARDEVGSLSESLNGMLARIEHSFAVREASEQRMRDFVADASHELRTPLATVKGYAELHRFGAMTDPEDVAGAMRRIEDEATRMTRLVEDLLTLTRWDSQPEMTPTRVDLTVLASDVVQDARVRAPQRAVRLVPLDGTEPDAAPVVTGEDGALRQVLTNLVANALAHTPDGTPVEVAVGRTGGRVVVEVRDHGQGLSDGTADRVFERFYRADKSRSRASGGTGLGLAIVAAIVGRHQGSVRHTPTPGGGATFRVELPADRRPGNS